jgi:hypothetical protein
VISLHRDTLTFTFPEIAREVRSLLESKIKEVAAELPPTWDRAALISKIESHRDFPKLTVEEQECARERLRIWTPADVESFLEAVVLNRGGLTTDSFIQLSVKFQRAWPIPNDKRSHLLPTDLGQFPLRSVDDFAETAPMSWGENGGVVMPLAQGGALWIWFSSPYSFAIKIGSGETDLLSSAPWHASLGRYPRNYLVIPEPSLEECREVIRQFINMPMREASVLHQRKSENVHSEPIELQITPARAECCYRDEGSFFLKPIEEFFMRLIFGPIISKQLDEINRRHERQNGLWHSRDNPFPETTRLTFDEAAWPNIPIDPHELSDWDQTRTVRCCVHVCDPAGWQNLQRVNERRHIEIRELLDAP